MIEKSNIIVLGSVDWITNWQTQHRLVDNLSKKNKVLFIENTGVRNLKFNDFSRVKDRFNNWKKSQKGFKKINQNLIVLSPIIIPFPHSRLVSKINSYLLNHYISNLKFFFNFKPNIVITFLPTKLSDEIMKIINCNINIYYCANEMTGVDNQNKKITDVEKFFFTNCDHTFVISKNLEEKAKKNSKRVSILPTGVELDKFNYAKVKKKIF